MSELPSWVNDQIKKGASLSDCLEMLKLLSEKDREERKIEREERQAEREMKKAALEHEVKVKELALKEEELKVARANGGNQMVVHLSRILMLSFLSWKKVKILMCF